MTADLPAGVVGGCGPNPHRLVLILHFQGQMTCERIVALLTAVGLAISKRQVVRLLTAELDTFRAEEEAVFTAGLRASACVSVDDTGGAPRRQGLLHDAVRLRPVHGVPHRAEQVVARLPAQSFGRYGALHDQRGGGSLWSISPSAISTASAPGTTCLSRLNGWPAQSPADASPPASRPVTRGSGPMRIATPSSCRTFTDYSPPVSWRTENPRKSKPGFAKSRGAPTEA